MEMTGLTLIMSRIWNEFPQLNLGFLSIQFCVVQHSFLFSRFSVLQNCLYVNV